MPERAALDLSDLLPLFPMLQEEVAREDQSLADETEDGLKFARPVRLGEGPLVWSDSRELARRQPVIWDVNGYYRELGVSPRATRRELREAYQARDGQSSARLTYVFRQLLDPLIREAYDNSPPGMPFLDDYVEDTVKRGAAREAQKRTARTGEFCSAEQVLLDWGYELTEYDEPVDTVASVGQDRSRAEGLSVGSEAPADLAGPSARSTPWEWASYAWRTSSYLRDERRLAGWQAALIRAANAQHKYLGTSSLAIGLSHLSDGSAFMFDVIDGQPVVFFPEDAEPSDEIAGDALDTFASIY